MTWFIYLFSIAWIAAGSFLILYTHHSRETMARWFAKIGRVPMSAAAAVIGILLVWAARGSPNAGVIVLIGLLAILKGALFFFNPHQLFEKTLHWWLEQAPNQTYRLAGIITIVLGTALFSWA
ncbi:MAG: hypothetical protein PVJ53_16225 [Desulfobacterales bacterium]|jgi:uncharacterized protein YjeT (DUF2065 family)